MYSYDSLFLAGIDIVKKALRIPCATIAANCGVDSQEVVTKVMQSSSDMGYDAMNNEYVNMISTGIIDPTKVRKHTILTLTGKVT